MLCFMRQPARSTLAFLPNGTSGGGSRFQRRFTREEALWCDALSSMATMAQLLGRPFWTCCHHLGQWVMDAHLVTYLSLANNALNCTCSKATWQLVAALLCDDTSFFFDVQFLFLRSLNRVLFNLSNFNHALFWRDWSAGLVQSPLFCCSKLPIVCMSGSVCT